MSDFYVDYSAQRGLDLAIDDGPPFHTNLSLAALLRSGTGTYDPATGTPHPFPSKGDRLIVEINFEPHDPMAHDEVVDLADEVGVELLCVSLRASQMKIMNWLEAEPKGFKGQPVDMVKDGAKRAEVRRDLAKLGITEISDNDDFNAVESIRATVRSGRHLKRPKRIGEEQLTDWQAFNRYRTSAGKTSPAAKAFFARKLTMLPSFGALIESYPRAKCLGSEKLIPKTKESWRPYADTLVVAMIIAAETSSSRDEFDRQMGLFDHGYPSIRRSMVTGRAHMTAEPNTPKGQPKVRRIPYVIRMSRDKSIEDPLTVALRDLRWASRLVYHLVKRQQAGTSDPATGTYHPPVGASPDSAPEAARPE